MPDNQESHRVTPAWGEARVGDDDFPFWQLQSLSEWHEIHRELLGKVELCAGHLAGDGIAQPQDVFAAPPRCMRGREVEPFVRKNNIRRDAEALVVHEPEQILAGRIALLG